MNIPTIFILMLLLSAMVQASANNDTKTVYISDTTCTFTFSQRGSHFQFNSCITKTQQTTNWNTCLSECCPEMPEGQFPASSNSIQVCKNYNSNSFSPIIIIVVCISALCLVLIVFFGCIVCCRLSQPSNRIVEDVRDDTDSSVGSQLVNKVLTKIIWSHRSDRNVKLPVLDSPCSICLQDGTTAILSCRHQFHALCIGSWLKKNKCCPNCRQGFINGIKVYCQECRWKYFVISKRLLYDDSLQLPKLCNNCDKVSGMINGNKKQITDISSMEMFFQAGQSLQSIPVN